MQQSEKIVSWIAFLPLLVRDLCQESMGAWGRDSFNALEYVTWQTRASARMIGSLFFTSRTFGVAWLRLMEFRRRSASCDADLAKKSFSKIKNCTEFLRDKVQISKSVQTSRIALHSESAYVAALWASIILA